jgi:hypothetical protein
MRTSTILFASILAVAAFTGCGKNDPANGDDDGAPDAAGSGGGSGAPGNAFFIRSSDIMLMPGEETTKCFYFHTPNTTALPINKWSSHMTPGSHHMIMSFSSGTSSKADGTIDEDCGLGGSATNVPIWVYASQTPDQELDLPADDGAGKPLAQLVPPNTAAVFQMHYLNTTDAAMTVHVELNAFALDAAAAYTPTAAYITYNNDITIPPNATGVNATGTCTAPTGVQFWTVSSHSHKQSVHTQINDGATISDTGMVFQSGDWEHPGSQNWMTSPFYTFTSGKLTFQCTYDNNNGSDPNHLTTIVAGQSAQFNEMCMATGYIFPATTYKGCLCAHVGNGTQCFNM